MLSAVAKEIGPERVGVRFAPFFVLGAHDDHKYALFTYVLEELNKMNLAYVHMVEPRSGENQHLTAGCPHCLYANCMEQHRCSC